jgi:putative oxidoreductase
MAAFMTPFHTQFYALMRMAFGFTFLWHGSQKLLGFPAGGPDGIPDFILYVAGPIELVGGLFVMVGFLASWSAFLCSGLMAAAYWMAHGTKAMLPIENGGELSVLYCFAFLFIAAKGAGIWSIDAARSASET